ncbi:MAG: multifunctional CCA tRNA nucleotidyl transferase/2'3'-cyclic phosphodiesterase/2'nucleotidase/phosphatase, partial [Gammaproteobacteria bacterium]|nr:multifunctional CCA tRNA nucleotidyl transferase/2'3'-cyclic phosphodiesterase/2'nucleotidase/phosphatase [Gammaproteobacteria bacterium]
EQFLIACEADARGRSGLEDRDYPQAELFRRAFAAAMTVDSGAIAKLHSGAKISAAISAARLDAIRELRN